MLVKLIRLTSHDDCMGMSLTFVVITMLNSFDLSCLMSLNSRRRPIIGDTQLDLGDLFTLHEGFDDKAVSRALLSSNGLVATSAHGTPVAP